MPRRGFATISGVGSLPLQKLGKYEILAELGRGAMGVVYKARDPFIGRLVALKTINTNLVDRPDLLERFYQEAQSAGKLQHPNIVTIFELGQEKDTPFIAMEYLNGESLEKTIVQQTELPLALRVGYIVRICQALEYAHKNRVVHRDIKPGNIMVNSEGVVKVVDFGIARLVDFSRTHTNLMIGTPAYMAPELFRKKKEKANERTDIWAVGVTFYELVCNQRPFSGDGYDIIRSIMEDEFPVVSSLVPDCPSEVESVIQRMLCKESVERYQSMEDVLLDLEPVWNRLRTSAATVLTDRARELYELGDLRKAQDRLRQARQIDSSNAKAKSLLEKISTELRRTEIEPRVQGHLSRGRVFLQSGQFREAQGEVEAALGLDSRCEPAQKLAAEVEVAAARAQQVEQKLRLTKQRLAEGALTEADSALQQALDLDASHPQVLELKRQLGQEQIRRERRKQLSELVQRARALWTELKYEECLAVISEGLKTFPDEPKLISLQETARADQLGQKKKEQEREKQIQGLVGAQQYREAADLARRAVQEFPNQDVFRRLAVEAEQKAAGQQLREKTQREVQQRVQEIRGKIKRQELNEAIELARQTLAMFGPDSGVKQLLQAAEVEARERDKKRQERQQHLEAARRLLDDGNFAGARQLLDRAMATKILESADAQTRLLLSQIAEKEVAFRGEAQKQTKPGTKETRPPSREEKPSTGSSPAATGRPSPPPVSVPQGEGPEVSESAANIVSAAPRQIPSVPVLTPLPAIPPQTPIVQTQIRIEERVPETPAAPFAAGFFRKPSVLAVLGLVLVGSIYTVLRFIPKGPGKPSAEDVALETEAKQLWDNHKMDDSLADWKKLASHPGALRDEATQQVSDIEQKHVAVEKLYAQGMKLLYEDKNHPEAAKKFNEVLQMNLWKMEETRREYDIASKGPVETPANPVGTNSQPPPNANTNSNASSNPNPKPTKKPPDYKSVLGEVRSLIVQSRWDDAEAKLSGVPPAQPDYTDLKRQIDAGRRDDQDFSQAKASFTIADASKHKDVLRALRPFFMAEANKPGVHSGEARNIVNQIDADLSGPDAVNPSGKGGGNPVASAAAAIKAVLERYAKAIDEADLEGLKAVRQYSPKEEKKLPKALKSTKAMGYALRNCALTDFKGESASVSCDAVLTKASDPKSQRIKLQLNRIAGQWMIVSASAEPGSGSPVH